MENKVALVTSVTKGIGLDCALKLAENGAKVAMGVRRMEATQEICSRYRAQGYGMFLVFFDALQRGSCPVLVEDTIERAGRIDILVNNFGIGKPAEDLVDSFNCQRRPLFSR